MLQQPSQLLSPSSQAGVSVFVIVVSVALALRVCVCVYAPARTLRGPGLRGCNCCSSRSHWF